MLNSSFHNAQPWYEMAYFQKLVFHSTKGNASHKVSTVLPATMP